MARITKAVSRLCVCLVAFLALSLLSETRPIASVAREGLRSLDARSPDPRMIPGTGDLLGDIFRKVGLDSLARLNKLENWKQNNNDPDVIDGSNITQPIVTSHQNNKSALPNTTHRGEHNDLPDPSEKPGQFLGAMVDILSSKLGQAMHSSDEVTL
ncbi:uncharacterized protein BDW47DRAFT_102052 [Aspergillus candidus]|uniref:Uncharacterized protein n=1 Tax=Aspergillus candidus TaxID=41067 RepID=A0A2I2FH68_ASPCN|nr:hypothetical protein BDW47DRAFT_102052 [Aspergillus candidus]PLB39985.1 hypothetical protein BDW47DRAFT_102052 [Aspergillus candidus]